MRQRIGPSRFLLYSFFLFSIQNTSYCGKNHHGRKVVNVDHHGAKGDGVTNDRHAFEKTWNIACSSRIPVVYVVPEDKTYLLKPLKFSGPCKSSIRMMLKGTIEASSNISDWNNTSRRHWIMFRNIKNFVIEGGGTINGKGDVWWKNSCKINRTLPCTVAPTAVTFFESKSLILKDLRIKNSQQIHVSIEKCKNVGIANMSITAPESSPNTDGIHIAGTRNIVINKCDIRTGDDCVSIVVGSRNVKGMDIRCGPGHGISIGSLGANNSKDHVQNVIMDTIALHGTTNGVRIKTWQGGQGYAKNIMFQNVVMHNVTNPIIIDQNYCDSRDPCHDEKQAVEVQRIVYKNITGTSASDVAVKFDCSDRVPCKGIMLQDINLVREGGNKAKSWCNNVRWIGSGQINPTPCE